LNAQTWYAGVASEEGHKKQHESSVRAAHRMPSICGLRVVARCLFTTAHPRQVSDRVVATVRLRGETDA